jgi:hypothetical protein
MRAEMAKVEEYQFQAEAKRLLELMIHSLYTNKEIFLRELISNASDALDRLRFEALTNPAMLEENDKYEIRLEKDKEMLPQGRRSPEETAFLWRLQRFAFGYSEKNLCAFAPLREPRPHRRFLAKARRRKARKGLCGKPEPCLSRRLEIVVNLNTQMQTAVRENRIRFSGESNLAVKRLQRA